MIFSLDVASRNVCMHPEESEVLRGPPTAEGIGLVNTKSMHAASAIDPRPGMIDKPRFRDSIFGAAYFSTRNVANAERRARAAGPDRTV